MSYLSVATIREDSWIRARVCACVATERDITTPPEQWVAEHTWDIAAQPGWADAWDYALLNHQDDPTYEPGKDPGVIPDGHILAAVQSIEAAAHAAEEPDDEPDTE